MCASWFVITFFRDLMPCTRIARFLSGYLLFCENFVRFWSIVQLTVPNEPRVIYIFTDRMKLGPEPAVTKILISPASAFIKETRRENFTDKCK